jgi:hypothetical protein
MYIIHISITTDTLGKLDEGKEYPLIACLVDFDSSCKHRYNIKVRKCGREIQYYLIPTDGISAYCFGMKLFVNNLTTFVNI